MIEYRIIEKKFDDGRSEFFPEHYNVEYKKRMCRIEHDGWFSISEQHKKILGVGYKTYDDALIHVENHKRNIKSLGGNIIEKKSHVVY